MFFSQSDGGKWKFGFLFVVYYLDSAGSVHMFLVLLVSCQAISTAFAPHFVAVVCSRDVRPYTFCYMMLYVWETYLANELVQNMDCVRMFFHFSDVVSFNVYSTL